MGQMSLMILNAVPPASDAQIQSGHCRSLVGPVCSGVLKLQIIGVEKIYKKFDS